MSTGKEEVLEEKKLTQIPQIVEKSLMRLPLIWTMRLGRNSP